MPHQATKLQMSAALLHVRGCLSMQRGFSSKELLKAFRGTEQLVQKVQDHTGLPKEELERMKTEDLQAEFEILGLDMSSAVSFEQFVQALLKLHGLRRIHKRKSGHDLPNTGEAAGSSAATVAAPRLEKELLDLKEKVASLAECFDLPKHEGCKDGSEVEVLQQQVRAMSERVDGSMEQVEWCKEQTEQAVGMVARLAETLQKQAMDSYNMEQALVKSESKLIGLQASSVSVLEGRLRAFVKAELESAVLTAMQDTRVLPRLQVLEKDHRQLCDAVEEDTRWLRDAVEALSESLGLDLATAADDGVKSLSPSMHDRESQAMSPSSPNDATMGGLTSPEGRNAALFAQLDADGDGDVSLKEFHAAKVADGQRKAPVS
ncbi:unnamed protein product [Symbiodinium natans]|uniref:EF-hand domain-containing protein n=1 Tax=Symbiodinium natans TaxID=878477 RepID=A0A812IC84_9DINO|nr:unnamed protein product [Symbiodinium natans]